MRVFGHVISLTTFFSDRVTFHYLKVVLLFQKPSGGLDTDIGGLPVFDKRCHM